ncbi:hypothetical protein [Pengzhenrongella phosphoraccumulans]|uniref:hypothetical protein n=1 Tax=Pengzhenrongella phosphoraccumulans TaxID=3114394 RepID=UPI00388E52DE
MQNDLASPATQAESSTPLLRRFLTSPFVQFVIVLGCSLLICAPFLVDRIKDTPGISPQDELSYIDTLVRIQNGQWVLHQGDTLDPETLQELGCRGVTESALIPNAKVCAGSHSDVVFYNTADIDPPVYHWSVAILAHIPFDLGATRNMITAARMLGILWCSLTMTAIFFLARQLGASIVPAAAAGLTVLWLSVTNIQFQYVTPHSTGALVGAVVALVVAARLRDRVGWWLVTLAGLLAATVKLTNLVVVMAAAAAFLAAYAWSTADGGPRPRRRLWDMANIGATSVLATLAWVVVRRLTRSSDVEPYAWAVVDHLTPAQVLENVAAFVQPWGYGVARGFAVMLSVAVFGTATWLVFRRSAPVVHRQLAIGLLAAAVLAPVALTLMNFVVTSYYVPTQGRYGLSLIPLAVALAAAQFRHRALQITLAVLTVTCLWLAWYQPPLLAGS